jgi:phosphoglycolate phosphatase
VVAPAQNVSYRLAIFDFDGTLADTFPWFARVIDGVAEEFGIARIGVAERQILRSCHAREILARLKVPMWQVPRIARRMRQLKALEAERLPLFPGVVELLRALAQHGVARAIASSDAEANVRATLGPENARLIDHYACGASLFGKSAKLRRVMQRFGVPPTETIYVGDELRDAEAARVAGIAFAAVSWGYSAPDALRAQDPDRFFTSVAEIAPALA